MADNLTSVLIGVCTAQRPKMLKACLDSLAVQVVPEHVRLRAVVVDNEAEPNNRAAVEAQSERFPFPLAYEHEPRRGIPFARNRVLDHALAMNAEWIAFIDDDEIAEPDWLSQLVSAAERYGCDVVQGQVYQFADGEEPSRENGKRRCADGTILTVAATDNILFGTQLIQDTGLGLRFDEEFAMSGGSDSDFFSKAFKLGAQIVYCNKAIVHERLMRDRLGTSNSIKRQLSYRINNYARRAHTVGGINRLLFAIKELVRRIFGLFQGFIRIVLGLIVIAFRPESGARMIIKGSSRIMNAIATIAAIFGYRYERYRKISGE